jgi:hypothetical protein
MLALDSTPVNVDIRLTDPIRSDTGEPVLVVQPNLLVVQRTIEVSPCVPGDPNGYDCATAPKGFVDLGSALAGTFTDTSGNVLASSVSVFALVHFESYTTNGYDETQQTCGFYGGTFDGNPGALSGTYWTCTWESDINNDAYHDSVATGIDRLSRLDHCPTQVIVNRSHIALYRVVSCLF